MTKKYKLHEAAKDFNVPSKKLIELLGKYFEGEKKTQTALEEKELDVIFDVLTAENAVDSLDSYFAMQKPAGERAPKAQKAESQKAPAKEAAKEAAKAPAGEKAQKPAAAAGAPETRKKEKDPNRPMQSRTKG